MNDVVPTDPQHTPREAPGIHNPAIVDRIRSVDSGNEVHLIAIQFEPWLAGAAGVSMMENKLNAYFGYVLQGFLVRDYPQYEDRQARIVVEVLDAPPAEIEKVLEIARSIARKNRLQFTVRARETGIVSIA